jgi:hypothetical protein
MLQIRKEQMRFLDQLALKNFEDRMIKHTNELFPIHCQILGDEGVREGIQYGLDRAKSYNILSESGVSFFIDLMFLLGRSFDVDPQLPWAQEILTDENMPAEAQRLERLYEKSMHYLDNVSGVNNEYIDEAQRRIYQEPIDVFSPSGGISQPAAFFNQISSRLRKIFPEKCAYIGEFSVRRLIQRGIEAAGSYGITSERGVAVYICLMFMLGSGFDTDPLFSWAAKILNDESTADQVDKVNQLYAGAMAYLERWCGGPSCPA